METTNFVAQAKNAEDFLVSLTNSLIREFDEVLKIVGDEIILKTKSNLPGRRQ